MAEVVEEDIRHDPKFINFLFTLKRYECHFVVGTKELQKPEVIGVVPVMLMAHSEVLQSEMFCREVEDKKCVRVTDMYPDTFRNLLRYVYGYDNTGTLSFDEANNLFYAADKYLIDSLTSRLVNRLVKMINPDNICSLLNNPACYRQLELDSAITQEELKMAEVVEEDIRHDPKFINFLFTLKRYECHFVVGTKELQKPEVIGVVPVMLMAHSEVLQSEMFCREVEDKKCVRVTDMYPDTFRNLLRYVYGYDNTGTLSFDEANNLFYAADKYLIDSLTSRLVNRLVKMINPDNICSLLNNPACYRQLELDSAITQILQLETKRVLDSPQFLVLTSDALVKVFEQEFITVEEIEVWRAAVKWAKQQAKSDNGQDLRKALEGPAKHIRVCTIDDDSFVNEVCPTGILTAEEINMVYFSKVKKEKQNDLVTFSNEVDHRVKNDLLSTINQILVSRELDFKDHSKIWNNKKSSLDIFVTDCAIEVLPFNFTRAKGTSTNEELKCTITITKNTVDTTNTTTELPQIIEVCNVPNGKEFSVAVAKEGKNIVLLPNSGYHVSVEFNKKIQMYYTKDNDCYGDENIQVDLSRDPDGYYDIPLKSLFYRASVTPVSSNNS